MEGVPFTVRLACGEAGRVRVYLNNQLIHTGEDMANPLQPDVVNFWLNDAQIQRLTITRRE